MAITTPSKPSQPLSPMASMATPISFTPIQLVSTTYTMTTEYIIIILATIDLQTTLETKIVGVSLSNLNNNNNNLRDKDKDLGSRKDNSKSRDKDSNIKFKDQEKEGVIQTIMLSFPILSSTIITNNKDLEIEIIIVKSRISRLEEALVALVVLGDSEAGLKSIFFIKKTQL